MKYLLDFSKRNSLEDSLYLINTETLATYEVSPLAEIHSAREYLSSKRSYTTVLEVNCQLDREEIIKCLYETYPELLL